MLRLVLTWLIKTLSLTLKNLRTPGSHKKTSSRRNWTQNLSIISQPRKILDYLHAPVTCYFLKHLASCRKLVFHIFLTIYVWQKQELGQFEFQIKYTWLLFTNSLSNFRDTYVEEGHKLGPLDYSARKAATEPTSPIKTDWFVLHNNFYWRVKVHHG